MLKKCLKKSVLQSREGFVDDPEINAKLVVIIVS